MKKGKKERTRQYLFFACCDATRRYETSGSTAMTARKHSTPEVKRRSREDLRREIESQFSSREPQRSLFSKAVEQDDRRE